MWFLLLTYSRVSQLGCQLGSLSPHPECAGQGVDSCNCASIFALLTHSWQCCGKQKHGYGYIPLHVELGLKPVFSQRLLLAELKTSESDL